MSNRTEKKEFFGSESYRVFVPVADLYEADDEYRVRVDIPGLDDKSVVLRVEDNILVIEGRMDCGKNPSDHRVYQKFIKEVELPERVSLSSIEAAVLPDVLEVVVPKLESLGFRASLLIQ